MSDAPSESTSGTRRVRFNRSAKKALTELPSYDGMQRGPVRPGRTARKPKPVLRRCVTIAAAFLAFIVIAAGALRYGLLDESIAQQSNEFLRAAIPEPLRVTTQSTSIGFSWPPSLGVRYDGFEIADRTSQTVVAKAQSVSVNLNILKSLAGIPVFSEVTVDGATVDLQAFEHFAPNDGLPQIRLADVPAHFESTAQALRAMFAHIAQGESAIRLSVSDTQIALPPNNVSDTITINAASGRATANTLDLSSELNLAGVDTSLDGQARLQGGGTLTMSVVANDAIFPIMRLRTFLSDNMEDHEPDAVAEPALTRLRLDMRDEPGISRDALRLSLAPKDLTLKLSDDDFVPVSGLARLDFEFDDNTVTWLRDRWRFGNSTAIVSARFRDTEVTAGTQARSLQPVEFEMLFNQGRITPEDSPEAPLTFASRVQGIIDASQPVIEFSNMELDTAAGYARAEGLITFTDQPPVALFDVTTQDMTIAGLKQLWPGTVAREARRWTLNNLAGGRVLSSRFQIAEPLRRRIEGTDRRLFGDSRVELSVAGVRFDLAGDLPPVRDGVGTIVYEDRVTTLSLESGTIFLPSGRTANASDGVLVIQPPDDNGFVMARADGFIEGEAAAIGEIIQTRPIEAQTYYPFDPTDLSGSVSGNISLEFALNNVDSADAPIPDWVVDLEVVDAASDEPIEGRQLAQLSGNINVTPQRAIIDVDGQLDGMQADMALTIPFEGSEIEPEQTVVLKLDDSSRKTLAPGLETVLTGVTDVIVDRESEDMWVTASLRDATFSLPWIGWSKGRGIPASVAFQLVDRGNQTTLDEFNFKGDGFAASGRIDVGLDGLDAAQLRRVALNPGDDFSVDLSRQGERYDINVEGSTVDLRALMRHVRNQLQATGDPEDKTPVNLEARFGTVAGFNGETMRNVSASARIRDGGVDRFSVTGQGASGMPFSVALEGQGSNRRMRVEAFDAGEFLRFLDLYGQVQGGALGLDLSAASNGDLLGPLEIRDFRIFNEPALDRLVSTRSDERGSLREAINRDLDLREVPFDTGVADLAFGSGTLDVSQAYIRGPLVGFAMQGRVFDRNNQTRITGTFLPAYGLNSVFAEIPILGLLLGNGRDRGLIGVTFLLEGDFDEPRVTVNPLSVIAPGIFRNIFQFR